MNGSLNTWYRSMTAMLTFGALSALDLQVQTVLVLEGFETNIASIEVFKDYGGRSAEGKVTIRSYTSHTVTKPPPRSSCPRAFGALFASCNSDPVGNASDTQEHSVKVARRAHPSARARLSDA